MIAFSSHNRKIEMHNVNNIKDYHTRNAMIIGAAAAIAIERTASWSMLLVNKISGTDPTVNLGLPVYITLEIGAWLASGALGALAGKVYANSDGIKATCKAFWNRVSGAGQTPPEAGSLIINNIENNRNIVVCK
jgi:hypothetical protein